MIVAALLAVLAAGITLASAPGAGEAPPGGSSGGRRRNHRDARPGKVRRYVAGRKIRGEQRTCGHGSHLPCEGSRAVSHQ